MTMTKVEMLKRIQKLATLVHGTHMEGFLSEETASELRQSLDTLTEEYIVRFCDAA
jgi:hypothetical protein